MEPDLIRPDFSRLIRSEKIQMDPFISVSQLAALSSQLAALSWPLGSQLPALSWRLSLDTDR
ncbi:unnamed protein product [Meloidogyne enterolobii]|uniref:Uncharacterized protein n=1 Tax=Meloidogyne enterolobii TaxID=390850 RepID=A0ACB1B071_MELEN